MDQFILVTYDISNDRRRTKLHNALLNYGTPVQYSVFECLLDAAGEKAMRAAVRRVIRPRVDNVRYYTLCASCRARAVGQWVSGSVVGRRSPSSFVVSSSSFVVCRSFGHAQGGVCMFGVRRQRGQ